VSFGSPTIPIIGVGVQIESDVVAARQRARQIAAHLGFDVHQQTKLATAVSEIARNAFTYGGGGRVEFSIEGQATPQLFVIRVTDSGPGIPDLARVLEGAYRSATGMGLGIIGSRRLMDKFDIESAPGHGVAIRMTKLLPLRAPLVTPRTLAPLMDELASRQPPDALGELRQQNSELLATLNELGTRQDDLVRLNRELEDTNRGVVALYAELDEKAGHLRRADETKSRFLSHMSHEFRTPLNSIVALSRLLLDRVDGDLTGDQERQVLFIRQSAESLYELANDLLDLAKVEAGKITVNPAEFDVKNLFGTLRGMLRPLLSNASVNLVFDEPEGLPAVVSDEAKVSQVLRNFVSNALKFTERGEVRITVTRDGDRVIFSVADTGIGIDPDDMDRIFQEFTQIESPIQRKVKGTGLGLPLSRKLAGLLGGSVSAESRPGVGSTFSLAIPIVYAPLSAPDAPEATVEAPILVVEPVDLSLNQGTRPMEGRCILVVDDDETVRYLVKQFFAGEPHEFVEAGDGVTGLAAARARHPELIFLDIMMPRMDGFEMLEQLRAGPETRAIPVIVFTARALSNRERRRLEAHGAAILPKDRLAAGDVNPSLREILAGIGLSGLLSTALSAARQSRQS
jgi:signal transduction histidine kinase/CheY-like chemotaxis protein